MHKDERRLGAMSKTTGPRWRNIAPNVLEFWTIERGRIRQKRLMKEWLYVREKSKKARAAVSMRKDRRGYERNTNVGTNDLHLGGGGGEGEGVLSGNRELVSREGDRKSVEEGKSGSVWVDRGGGGRI